uniref:Uncharacterized protein n=1 Tax=Panagrellus redivivus TaxID=6233 RepID=A0A7E4VAH0_PANRE
MCAIMRGSCIPISTTTTTQLNLVNILLQEFTPYDDTPVTFAVSCHPRQSARDLYHSKEHKILRRNVVSVFANR